MTFVLTKNWCNKFGIQPKNKYHNIKVKKDGYIFDSKAEYYYYLQCKEEKEHGKIEDFIVHPKFTLLPAFKDNQNKTIRAIIYTADFEKIYYSGTRMIIDIKSKITVKKADYNIRKKLLLNFIKDKKFIFFKEIIV